MNKLKDGLVVIAGGGSGGHVFPALAIAQGLVDEGIPSKNIIFYGSKRTLESEVVPQAGYELVTFSGRGLNRNEYLKNIGNTFAIFLACLKACFLLAKNRPQVVVGVGGYASVPALFAATILRIPRVIHEQNSYVGRTNALAQKFGAKMLTTFEHTKGAESNSTRVGLPMRENISELQELRKKFLDSKRSRPVVLVSGGSLGSLAINNAVIEMMVKFKSKINFDLVHICGVQHYETVREKYEDNGISSMVSLHSFRDDIFAMYARSNCVISRAGAGTCVELESLAVKCILIPLPNAPGDHQRLNASGLVNSGTGVILSQSALNPDALFEQVESMLSNDEVNEPNSFHNEAKRRIASYLIETYLLSN